MPACNHLLLQANCPRTLPRAAGGELLAVSGIVWLTEEGAAGDRFLHAGDSHRIAGQGRVVVEAVRGAACVELRRASPRPLGEAAATSAVAPAPTFNQISSVQNSSDAEDVETQRAQRGSSSNTDWVSHWLSSAPSASLRSLR